MAVRMISWTLQPIFNSYVLAVAVAVLLAALLPVRPSFGSLTKWRRILLVTLRACALLVLLAALLRPTLIFVRPLAQSASLLILFDTSRSMQLPDARESRSRWQSQRELLERVTPLLAELEPRMQVRIYGYDQQLTPITKAGAEWKWPDLPTGAQTDISGCLDEAVQKELGHRIAAVILLGDGVQTAYDPQVPLHEAGRQLARLGTPLYAVAFGQAADIAEARDVAVENLPEQYTSFVQNEITLRGILRVQGFAGQTIPVELIVTNAQGQEKRIGPKQITIPPDARQIPVEMSYTPTEAGQYKVLLQVPPQPGELVTTNNSLASFLTVLEGGLRVLYIYGSLVGEQRNLRWALESSPDISLRHIFIDPRHRNNWPDDRTAILQSEKYDVFLLENIHAKAFRENDLRYLAEAAANGSGLMMMGGIHSFGPGGYAQTPLQDVLPVEMSRLEQQDVAPLSAIRNDVHWMPEGGIVMVPSVPHPITRLAADSENESLWRKLPPLSGANRFDRIKPTARVLAESPQGQPLLVAGEYGRGRVLAFAGDSTRLWWQFGYEAEHKRFWRQVILWLAQRDEQQHSDVWLKIPQRRFPPAARIDVTAGVRSPTGDAVTDVHVSLALHPPDGTTQTVELQRQEDHFVASLRDLKTPGDYRLEATATRGAQVVGQTTLTFQVIEQDVEFANVAADPDQLARLAHLTREVGGRLVAAEQLPAVLAELHNRLPEETLQVLRRWRLGDTFWDAGALFVLMVGILTIEWFLRKRWGLV